MGLARKGSKREALFARAFDVLTTEMGAPELEAIIAHEFAEELTGRTITDYCQQAVRAYSQTVKSGTVVIISDVHVPFHNKQGVQNVVEMCAALQPEWFVINGDFLDCLAISAFPKPPGVPLFQEEIDAGREILEAFREAMPRTKFVWLDGNHEQRLERAIMAAPGFYGMNCLTIPELMRLEAIDCHYQQYMEPYVIGDLTIVHGNKVSKHSAYSAKAHLIDNGFLNVAIGHTHRQGVYKHSGGMGVRRAYELGGLWDINQVHYIKGRPNWQGGFGVAYIQDGKLRDLNLIEMGDDGSFVFDGRVYG